MKLMIVSDIHGSAYYCRKMLEAYDREKADKLLLLGDILYHGPRNDLPKEYAPKEVIVMLNARKQELLCVRGNCDTDGSGISDSGGLLFFESGRTEYLCNTWSCVESGKAADAESRGYWNIDNTKEADRHTTEKSLQFPA